MGTQTIKLTAGSGTSTTVERCQVCDHNKLEHIIFLGYLPPVNKMPAIGTFPAEQPSYPALFLNCPKCQLVQLGLIVDPKVLFPSEYPYTSSTTKVLRENFADLYLESSSLINLSKDSLVIDIGSNDGNLLSNFVGKHKVLGVTPEEIGKLAIAKGIPTLISYFNSSSVQQILKSEGKAKIVTATNVFAHIENVHQVVEDILDLLTDDGVFISESHYLMDLIETLQYDTIYHEHLRYYSVHSLKFLLEKHGLEIFHVKAIPSHGGSIRVYAAKKGKYPKKDSVEKFLKDEKMKLSDQSGLESFRKEVVISKMALHALLLDMKKKGNKIYGIGAPSRASTLINYVGLDEGIIDSVLEIKGSYKIGKYIPGTLIPVEDEAKLFTDQPEYAVLFSWHIADELAPKLKAKGFKGDFIVPLPQPRIIKNSAI
jgi:hypothetical protein